MNNVKISLKSLQTMPSPAFLRPTNFKGQNKKKMVLGENIDNVLFLHLKYKSPCRRRRDLKRLVQRRAQGAGGQI